MSESIDTTIAPYLPLQLHVASVLRVAALAAPVLTYAGVVSPLFPNIRWPGLVILLAVPVVVLLALQWVLTKKGTAVQSSIRDAIGAECLESWELNGQALEWFRHQRLTRYWRWYGYLAGGPIIVGIIAAACVVCFNLLAGVSTAHCLKMGGAILLTAIVLATLFGGLRWVMTYPVLRCLAAEQIQVFISPSMILAGDLVVEVDRWNRSRELSVEQSDGLERLRLILTRTNDGMIYKLQSEIPVADGYRLDMKSLTEQLELNANRRMHVSSWGWYGKR